MYLGMHVCTCVSMHTRERVNILLFIILLQSMYYIVFLNHFFIIFKLMFYQVSHRLDLPE